ncbi:hypothetical protein [Halovivax gelatinilyticus]|uniref:hypothetical protein n=1 Tax=Halovivax gelatinilyticus TaxID=2961597 RepID=UPI0020CA5CDE|nr:hypothetical protein [Halovivax gelatinilyticus]
MSSNRESDRRAEELLESLGVEDWASVDPRDLAGVDMRDVPDEALPTDRRCPRCFWPVFQITTTGPHSHALRPCGCRVASVDW